MSESYCMKSCSECGECSGCRSGAYSAQCDIAKCCREKWHLSCESCTRCGGCPIRLSRDRMPGMIQEKERREAQAVQSRKERIHIMKTWLPLIFGAVIAMNVVDLVLVFFDYLNAGQMVGVLRGLTNAGLIVTMGFGYWKLQRADEGFHFVAICHWLGAAYELLDTFLLGDGALGKILALLLAVVFVMSTRSECLGYRDALSGIERGLQSRWDKQWTQMVYALVASGVSLLIMILIPMLGLFVFLCSIVFIVFLRIRSLVYLYQTMDFCRWHDQ